jgi:hypothetical protein
MKTTKSGFAPIALFAYKRLDHLKRCVESLQRNPEARQSELFAFSDGPKSLRDKSAILEIRRYLKGLRGFKKVHLTERAANLGLSRSIIEGVGLLTAHFGQVIVVEDDLILSPGFLKYMNAGLHRYQKTPNVASIHAYNYPLVPPLDGFFFLRGADCWGWATWKRAWDAFEPDGKRLLADLEASASMPHFNFDGAGPFLKMLKDQIRGKNDSWAIRWHASAYLKKWFTLYPAKSLVHNIGEDGSGTHSTVGREVADIELEQSPSLVFPRAIAEDPNAWLAFQKYFRSQRVNLLLRIVGKLRRILS